MWVVENLYDGFVSPFFLCSKITKQPIIMKKIIITFITTIVLIVPFEKTQGQTITSTDFPRANATIGATYF